MSESQWEDRGHGHGGGGFPAPFQQTLLKGPIEASELEAGRLQPTHEYSQLQSREIWERYRVGPNKFGHYIVNIYFSSAAERLTIVLNQNVNTALKHFIAGEILEASLYVCENPVVTFAWPSEHNNNPSSILDVGEFDEFVKERISLMHTIDDPDVRFLPPPFYSLHTGDINKSLPFPSFYASHTEFSVHIMLSDDPEEGELEPEKLEWYGLMDVLLGLMESSIYEIWLEDRGSWLKRMKAMTFDKIPRSEIDRKLLLLSKAAEDAVLLKTDLPVNAAYMAATEKMLAKIGSRKKAAILIGSLLILKHEGDDEEFVIVTKRLEPAQIAFIEQNPRFLSKPLELLPRLQQPLETEQPAPVGGAGFITPGNTFLISGVLETETSGEPAKEEQDPSPPKRKTDPPGSSSIH